MPQHVDLDVDHDPVTHLSESPSGAVTQKGFVLGLQHPLSLFQAALPPPLSA